ncbi:MAG: PAS domain-containing protein [Cyclobacteriaceae bacterium]
MTTWKEDVSILHLEDNLDDVELLRLILDRSELNYSLKAAYSKEEFETLFSDQFDLIISDYNLKNYNGLSAIKWIRARDPLIPIIVLSGTVGEELAVDLLKAGASDFVLKSNLKNITMAIDRVLAESKLTWEKEQFQKELVDKNLILDTIFDSFEDIIFLKDSEGKYIKVNKAFCEYLEVSEEDVLGKGDADIFPESISRHGLEKDELVMLTGKPITYEVDHENSRSNRIILEVVKTPLTDQGMVTGIIGECRNITKQKILLEKAEKAKSILNQAEKLTDSGSFEFDADLDVLQCSTNFKRMMQLQIEGDTISFRKFANMVKEEDRNLFVEGLNTAIDTHTEYYQEHRFNIGLKESRTSHFKVSLKPNYKDENGFIFYGTLVDVTTEYENHISMIEKQEEDRKEIARELHDNLGQKLNATSMFVSKICDDMPSNKDLIKVKEIVHDSIDDLSFLINNISVKQVEEHSLDYAIEKLIDYLPESMSMKNNNNLKEDCLSNLAKAQVYRIVQEVLNNTVKYSEASEVKMDLSQEGSILSLRIEDNGKGFDVHKVKGNGLQNITHRVRKSNGLINIDSMKGKGTRVNVKMPIN